MFTVALIGADGAGKTSICRRLVDTLPLPARYVYMGANPASSNLALPTTRLWRLIRRARGMQPHYGGPADPSRISAHPKSLPKRLALGLKSAMSFVNRIVEEWLRQGQVWYYQSRGYIVVLDRHLFFDYYAYEIAENGTKRPLTKRLHGKMLARLYPRPELVICLDAPAEVLLQRKQEGTFEVRESRRQEYLQFNELVKNFVVVDAAQPEDAVFRQVAELICAFYRAKKGGFQEAEVRK